MENLITFKATSTKRKAAGVVVNFDNTTFSCGEGLTDRGPVVIVKKRDITSIVCKLIAAGFWPK